MANLNEQVRINTEALQQLIDQAKKIGELISFSGNPTGNELLVIEKPNGETVSITAEQFSSLTSGVQVHSGTGLPSLTPPSIYKVGDFYKRVIPPSTVVQSFWQFNGLEWVRVPQNVVPAEPFFDYDNIAEMLADQPAQLDQKIYLVKDASDDRNLEFDTNETKRQAAYRYKDDGENQDIEDYTLLFAPYDKSADGADGDDGREIQLRKGATYIQWKYDTESVWNNLILISDLKGVKGDKGDDGGKGDDGADGQEIELRKGTTYIQWRLGAGTWKNLILISDLKGEKGDDGQGASIAATVETGTAISLSNPIGAGDESSASYNDDVFTIKPNPVFLGWGTRLIFTGGKTEFPTVTGATLIPTSEFEEGKMFWLNVINRGDAIYYWFEAQEAGAGSGGVGIPGPPGADGKPAVFQKSATHIQWKLYGDELWGNLVLLKELKGDKGDKGDKGEPGDPGGGGGGTGNDGVDGKTVLNGTTVPAAGLGTIGDFYYRTTNQNMYGPKKSSGWGAGVSLKGAKGDKGDDGEKGDKGDTGARGLTGQKGDKGDKGEPGDPGGGGTGGGVTTYAALTDRASVNLPTMNTPLKNALLDKVDKVSGKGLSTKDYTTTEKNKLSGIEAGAQVNVTPTWAAVTGKPTKFPPSAHTQLASTISNLEPTVRGYFNKPIKKVTTNTYTLIASDTDKILHFTNTSGCKVNVPKGLPIENRYEGKQFEVKTVDFNTTAANVVVPEGEKKQTDGIFSPFALDCTALNEYVLYGRLALL